jgi:hypothetical protein
LGGLCPHPISDEDERHNDYGYTEEWVRLLIEKFKDEKAYDEMFAKSPGAAS